MISCVTDHKEHDNEYMIVLDTNCFVGFTQHGSMLSVSFPEMNYSLNQKFIDLFTSTLGDIRYNRKWKYDILCFDYRQSDSVYVDEFMHVVEQETKKIFPESHVTASNEDGTIYVMIE
jgi:hypothetical protein